MTTTTNYQLPVWSKTDRIRMADFNGMTAKLDAALAGKLPMAVLHDETLAEDKSQLTLDMAAEGWADHTLVLLTYTPPANITSGTVSVSNFSGAYYIDYGFSDTSRKTTKLASFSAGTGLTMFLLTGRSGSPMQTAAFAGQNFQFGYSAMGPDKADYPLTLSGVLPQGTRVQVIGLL